MYFHCKRFWVVGTVSSEETHVGSAHAVVRVAHTGEHPLGPGLSTAVRTEEVEEDCGVEWSDGLLTEVVIVGLNLVAPVVVGALCLGRHQAGVSTREFKKRLFLVLEVSERQRSHKSIELLFLISEAVIFVNDASSQVLKELLAETLRALLNLYLISVESLSLSLRCGA